MAANEKGIFPHLEELRRRLIICLTALAAGIIIAFVFADQLFHILILPAGAINLIFVEVTEMLGTYMQVCLIGGTNAALWTRPAVEIIAQLATDLDALPHHRGLVVTSAGVMPPCCAPDTASSTTA